MFWLLHLILWVHPFQDALNFSRAFTLISITFSPNFRIRTYFLILAYHFNNLYQISHSGPMRVFFFFFGLLSLSWVSYPILRNSMWLPEIYGLFGFGSFTHSSLKIGRSHAWDSCLDMFSFFVSITHNSPNWVIS